MFKVYESVILWVKHNIESRSKYLPEFLKAIRLFQMSIDYLSDVVEQEDLIKSNAKCKNYTFMLISIGIIFRF